MADIPIDKNFADINRVIEASAGTGKTYNLIKLAVSLVESGKAKVEETLIVTFTEKAAGEIKERLREGLKSRLVEDGVGADAQILLSAALDTIEMISVNTIHGFCQKTLSQYAFENRLAGENALVNDNGIYRTLLKSVQRKYWPKWMEGFFERCLYFTGYPDFSKGGSRFEQTIIDLCSRWNPLSGDKLLPEGLPVWDELKTRITGAESVLEEQKNKVMEFLNGFQDIELFYTGLGNLNAKGNMFKPEKVRTVYFESMFRWAGSQKKSDDHWIIDFYEHCVRFWIYKDSRFNKPDKPLVMPGPAEIKGGGECNYQDVCPQLKLISDIFETCRGVYTELAESLKARLILDSVTAVKNMAGNYKTENGLQSYQDMINRLWTALDTEEGSSPVLDVLRSRYKYALVDEFQDTDDLQWKIFRKIFDHKGEGDAGNHSITIIGDPKQSIYRFRGADVNSYLKARQHICGGDEDQIKILSENWRAHSSMITGLNQLFTGYEWFPDMDESSIKVEVPRENNDRIGLKSDNSGRKAITVVKPATADCKSTQARIEFSEFTAREIKGLLGSSAMEIMGRNGYRKLDENDICILLNKRSEFPALKIALENAGIPYTFYKQTGIWQSDEAVQLNYLFKYFSRPADKNFLKSALLTDYFGHRLMDLAAFASGRIPKSILKSLEQLEDWSVLAARKQWPGLFRKILRESDLLESLHADELFDRKTANLFQIIQTLEQEGANQNMDVFAMSEFISGKCSSRLDEAEQEYHRMETEEPKVRIMTMHSSKGLEFPVVFVLGGLTKGNFTNNYYVFHRDGSVCYDICLADENKGLHKAEIKQEEARLLYVALTRAQYKLYLPRYKITGHGSGSNGPSADILYSAMDKVWPGEVDTDDVNFIDTGDNLSALKSQVESEKDDVNHTVLPESINKAFQEPPDSIWHRKVDLTSFSSLKKRVKTEDKDEGGSSQQKAVSGSPEADEDSGRIPVVEFSADFSREQDEPDVIGDDTGAEEDLPADPFAVLPKGEPTGSMIHEVFEHVNFQEVGKAEKYTELLEKGKDSARVIDEVLQKWGLYKPEKEETYGYRVPTAELVFNALNSPLNDIGFTLSSLEESAKLHELEFYFPHFKGKHAADKIIPDVNETPDGYVQGFMDLIFKNHQDSKFYLLDWKSNTLDDGYAFDAMDLSMKEAHYDYQYKIYILALFNWMIQHGIDPEVSFGGVYYLYLRGMDGSAKRPGVYFKSKVELSDCADTLKGLVGYES